MLQVLVDADNVAPPRLQPVLRIIGALHDPLRLIAAGRVQALRRVSWPDGAVLFEQAGWQRADAALAQAYSPAAEPLLLVSGDGDFGLLAARHPGPVLVISGAASLRLHEAATVLDPALEGTGGLSAWLDANGVR